MMIGLVRVREHQKGRMLLSDFSKMGPCKFSELLKMGLMQLSDFPKRAPSVKCDFSYGEELCPIRGIIQNIRNDKLKGELREFATENAKTNGRCFE
jgi:hypothetical protein